MNRLILFAIVIGLTLSMTSCGPGLLAEPTFTPAPTSTPVPTSTPTPIPTPTLVPSPTPTPIGGGRGQAIFSGSIAGKAPLPNGHSVQFTGSQLMRYDFNTSEQTSLITPEWMSEKIGKDIYRTEFVIAPDGSKAVVIAYTAVGWEDYGYYDEFEYYIASIDPESVSPLLDVGARQIVWYWSPDSSKLLGLFVSDTNFISIYTVNSDGSGLKMVKEASYRDINNAAWMGNDKIVYLQNGIPMVMNSDGTDPQRLGDSDTKIEKIYFSPDGEKTVYILPDNTAHFANNDFSNVSDIGYFDDCDGNFPQRVLAWSPDNQYVVISSASCVFVKLLGQNIPKITKKTSLVRISDNKIITAREGLIETDLCGWTPDNKFAYIRVEDKTSYLAIVDVEYLGETEPEFKTPFRNCPNWIR